MKYRLFSLLVIGVLLFTVDGLGKNKITFQKDGTGRLIKRLRNNYFVKVEDVPGDKKYNLYYDRMDETTDIMITIFNEKGIYIKDIRLVGSNNERVRGVSERDNNELIIIGSTSSRDGDFKYLTTDEFMMIIHYNGTKKYSVSKLESTYYLLYEFVITNDDNLVVSGKTNDYPHLIKYNTGEFYYGKYYFIGMVVYII